MCLVFTRTLYLKRTKFCAISLLEFVPKRPNENAYWYKKALVGFSRCHFSIPLLYKNLRWLLFSYNHVTNKINHHTYQSGISYNNWIELLNKMLECNHSNGINQLVWFFALWEVKSSTFCLTISAFSFFFYEKLSVYFWLSDLVGYCVSWRFIFTFRSGSRIAVQDGAKA